MAADSASFTFTIAGRADRRSTTIQGAAHISPLVGPDGRRRPGIVTARSGERLLHAGPEPGRRPRDLRGHLRLHLVGADGRGRRRASASTARVQEFRPGGAATGNLTTTELVVADASTVLSSGNPLPAAGRHRHRRPRPAGHGDRGRRDRQRRDERRLRPGQRRHRLLREPRGHARPARTTPVAVGPTQLASARRPWSATTAPTRRVRTARGGMIAAPERLQPRAHHPRRRCSRRSPDAERRRPLHRPGRRRRSTTTSATSFVEVDRSRRRVVHDGVTPRDDRRPRPRTSSRSRPSTSRTSPRATAQSKFDALAEPDRQQPAARPT